MLLSNGLAPTTRPRGAEDALDAAGTMAIATIATAKLTRTNCNGIPLSETYGRVQSRAEPQSSPTLWAAIRLPPLPMRRLERPGSGHPKAERPAFAGLSGVAGAGFEPATFGL